MSKAKIKTLLKQMESGNLKTNEALILNLILNKDSTLEDIENLTMLRTPTIQARLSALEDLGVIFKKEKIRVLRSITGEERFQSIYSYESNPSKIIDNKEKREVILFKKAAKSLLRYQDKLTPDTLYELRLIICD